MTKQEFDGFLQDQEENFIEIDFVKYIRIAIRNWKKIAIWAFAAAVLGSVLSYGVPKKYKVVSRIAPELSLKANNLSSLASLAGLNLGNSNTNNSDALLPTIYPEIVNSIPFITDLFEMPVKESTLYDYMLNDVRQSWGETVLSLITKPITAIADAFTEDGNNGDGTLDNFYLTKEQEDIYKAIKGAMKVEVEKKSFIVTITVIMQDPEVAADLSKAVIENLKKYVTQYRTDKARQNAEFLQKAFDNARDEYYQAQNEFAAYCDAHQSLLSQSSMVEYQRLQNETNMKYQLYSSVAQQLQQAQVNVQQEAPVFAEVIPPTIPVRKFAPKRSRYALAFMLLGAIAAYIYCVRKEGRE